MFNVQTTARGMEFQICKMKRVLKNGYKNIKILNTTERYTLKNGYNGKFYVLCLLPQFFLTFEKKKKSTQLSHALCSEDGEKEKQVPWLPEVPGSEGMR
jgi:hypothetical protein